MTRRALVGSLVLSVVLLIGLITYWDEHRRVVYHGRSLIEWEAALYDTSAGVRDTAAYALSRLVSSSTGALPAVIRAEAVALADENPDVRADATSALITLGRSSDAVVPAVVNVVEQNASDRARVQALQVIAALGPAATSATLAVIHALDDSSAAVRLVAVTALGRLGVSPLQLGVVVHVAFDQNADVRAAAIEALVTLGAPSNTLLAVAERGTTDPDPLVRAQSVYAFAAAGQTSDIIERLTHALDDSDARVRMAAATVLGRLGPRAATAAAALRRAAADSDREVRRVAEEAVRAVAHP